MQHTYIVNKQDGLVAVVEHSQTRLAAGTVVLFGHQTSGGRVVNARKGKITRGKKWDDLAAIVEHPLYAAQVQDGLEPEFLLR
jgi:hypothetical protein